MKKDWSWMKNDEWNAWKSIWLVKRTRTIWKTPYSSRPFTDKSMVSSRIFSMAVQNLQTLQIWNFWHLTRHWKQFCIAQPIHCTTSTTKAHNNSMHWYLLQLEPRWPATCTVRDLLFSAKFVFKSNHLWFVSIISTPKSNCHKFWPCIWEALANSTTKTNLCYYHFMSTKHELWW